MEIYLSQKNIRINRKILCDLLKHVTTAKHKRVQNAAFSSYAPRAHRVAGQKKTRENGEFIAAQTGYSMGQCPLLAAVQGFLADSGGSWWR